MYLSDIVYLIGELLDNINYYLFYDFTWLIFFLMFIVIGLVIGIFNGRH